MKTKLFLSDLDGTLTKGSLVLQHAGFLISEKIIEDDGSYHAWEQDKKNEKLIVAVAENYRHAITGLTVESLQVESFVKSFVMDKENFYSTLGMLQAEKTQGSRVILITGSSDFLVKELANVLDFEYKATEYKVNNGVITGDIVPMFHEQAKSDFIQWEVNVNEYQTIGLGDTASDLGIFRNCEKNILVDPSTETLEKVMLSQVKISEIVKA